MSSKNLSYKENFARIYDKMSLSREAEKSAPLYIIDKSNFSEPRHQSSQSVN